MNFSEFTKYKNDFLISSCLIMVTTLSGILFILFFVLFVFFFFFFFLSSEVIE